MSAAQDFKLFLQEHEIDFTELHKQESTTYYSSYRFDDSGITVEIAFHFDTKDLFAECGIFEFGRLDNSLTSYQLLNNVNATYKVGKFFRMDDGTVVAKTTRCLSDLGLDCQAFFNDFGVLLNIVEEVAKEIVKSKWS